MIDAGEAYRLGLVTRVVPDDQLMASAEELANQILKNSQQAVRSAKETILDVLGRTLDDALRLETLNAYSSVGDFSEVNARLRQFHGRKGARDTGR
jgi:enoyl-CoA hydratase